MLYFIWSISFPVKFSLVSLFSLNVCPILLFSAAVNVTVSDLVVVFQTLLWVIKFVSEKHNPD